MPAVLDRYQRQVRELRRGVKALKFVRQNPELLDEYPGMEAFKVAEQMIESGTGMLDMPEADSERVLRFMADHMDFVSQHGSAAFEKACEKLKIRFHRTPLAAFQDDDAEPAPQGGPIFGGDLPGDALGAEFNQTGQDLNDPAVGGKVLRYMNEHPELAQKYGSSAFQEAAKILRITPR